MRRRSGRFAMQAVNEMEEPLYSSSSSSPNFIVFLYYYHSLSSFSFYILQTQTLLISWNTNTMLQSIFNS
ncbi:hypothetical protein L6452_35117 [Arctium lappa]|uniref:Uncharacterized protein n=1 Tax=Arctium lappa TaxID=4217 RepID=A0ACB8YL69_ARCLA|nr:hypothetical protein L6452_35117 [Arctium lappa]